MEQKKAEIVIEQADSEENAVKVKKSPMRIVDLKGQQDPDQDSANRLGEKEVVEDDENDPIESPEELAYEKPAPMCSFFVFTRTWM